MQTLCRGTGIWTVSADSPIYTPAKIRFNWNDGTGWQETGGTSYLISPQPRYSQDFTPPFSFSIPATWGQCTVTLKATHLMSFSGCSTQLANWLFADNYTGTVNFSLTRHPTQYDYMCGALWWCRGSPAPSWARDALYKNIPTITITSKSYQYNLKIWNNSSLVYDQTKITNPTVVTISEKCEYTGVYNSVYSEINLDTNAFLTSETNGNNVLIKRCVGSIINNQVSSSCSQVASVSGSCAVPKIKATQEPLCPPGTCELECGGTICCYNDLGLAVRSYAGGAEV